MTSRLPREDSVAGRRVAVVVWVTAWVFDVGLDTVDVDAADFVVVVLEEVFDLRPLVLVLKGFAVGARLMGVADFSGEVAREAMLPEIAIKRSAVARRWSSIYCTPVGLAALFGWVEAWELEAWEMTGAGSFCCGAE